MASWDEPTSQPQQYGIWLNSILQTSSLETRMLEKKANPRKLIWIMFWIKCIYLEKKSSENCRILVLIDKVKFYVVYTLSEKLLLRAKPELFEKHLKDNSIWVRLSLFPDWYMWPPTFKMKSPQTILITLSVRQSSPERASFTFKDACTIVICKQLKDSIPLFSAKQGWVRKKSICWK